MSWGTQVHVANEVCDLAQKEGIECELIDLQTILPWDKKTIAEVSISFFELLSIYREFPGRERLLKVFNRKSDI